MAVLELDVALAPGARRIAQRLQPLELAGIVPRLQLLQGRPAVGRKAEQPVELRRDLDLALVVDRPHRHASRIEREPQARPRNL